MKIAIVMELDTASYAQSKYGSNVSFDEVRSWAEEVLNEGFYDWDKEGWLTLQVERGD